MVDILVASNFFLNKSHTHTNSEEQFGYCENFYAHALKNYSTDMFVQMFKE